MNWNTPLLSTNYTDLLQILKDRDTAAIKFLDGVSLSNLPTGAKRWNKAASKWEEFNGTTWVNMASIYEIAVIHSRNSDKLGGKYPSYYALSTHNHDTKYLGIYATAKKALDSDKLGGLVPSKFSLKTDKAPDSSLLDGKTFSQLQNLFIPKGLITMWSGPIINIPDGWYLCNGENGTPNMVDKFVMGTDTNAEIGQTGGSADSVIVEHTHTGSISSDGEHGHTLKRAEGYRAGLSDYAGNGTPHVATAEKPTSLDGEHTHSMSIDNTGESGKNKNLPPYYKIAFIMKG